MASSNVDWKPRLGMELDIRDKIYQFYLAYSLRAGFGVRIRNANKKKDGSISSCRLVCCKEGLQNKEKKDAHQGKIHRAETITDCKNFTFTKKWKVGHP
jgi:hypothetical protein